MTRAIAGLMAVAMMAGVMAGCGKDEKPTPGPGKGKPKVKGAIGISVLTMKNPFFKEIVDAVAEEAGKNGYDVIAVDSDQNPGKQRAQVKDFIVKKVVAIILTPADSEAVGAAVKEANKAGVPIFTADIACDDKTVDVVSHIATDNYSGGRQAAKAMMKALGNEGEVAIIGHPEVESVKLRTKGFRDELKAAGSKIQIVGSWPGKGAKDESFRVAKDILTRHKDLNGIFAINDPTALGAHAALEKQGKVGQVMIVGFDGQLDGKKAIKAGHIYADPIQFPKQIGSKTVQVIMDYMGGKKVKPQYLIPTRLYYKADAEADPELK